MTGSVLMVAGVVVFHEDYTRWMLCHVVLKCVAPVDTDQIIPAPVTTSSSQCTGIVKRGCISYKAAGGQIKIQHYFLKWRLAISTA